MAAVAPQPKQPAPRSQAHPIPNGKAAEHASTANGLAPNGTAHPSMNVADANWTDSSESGARPAATKKAASKKAADPSETSKLLAAKISQLESDQAGEKDQEAEIGGWRLCWICLGGLIAVFSRHRSLHLGPVSHLLMLFVIRRQNAKSRERIEICRVFSPTSSLPCRASMSCRRSIPTCWRR